MTREDLRQAVAAAVVTASDGQLSMSEVLAEKQSLTALGVTSLAYLRVIDAIEMEHGVYLDLDVSIPDTVDAFVERLVAEGVAVPDSVQLPAGAPS